MKFFAKIFLGIFILFQFSTIIICVINDRNKTNITINITEEEEHAKEIKVVKSEFVVMSNKLSASFIDNSSQKAQDTYLLKNYAANATIFLVPPEQV